MKAFRMTDVLMKSFRRKAVTLMYPDVPAKCFENTKGRLEIDLKKCTMCGACSEICPAEAVAIDKDAGQWTVQRMQCVLCGQCMDICPENCLFMRNEYAGAETEKIMDVYDSSELEEECTDLEEECVSLEDDAVEEEENAAAEEENTAEADTEEKQ